MNLGSLFTPVQVGRAGEDVALQIEAAIMDEKIKPGRGCRVSENCKSSFKPVAE